MIKTKTFNNIAKQPEFKRTDIKVFQWLHRKPDKLNPGKIEMPIMAIVPNTDRVYDADKDDYVDIAAIKSTGQGGKEILHTIVFMLSNANASNPDRDTEVRPLYELLNPKAKADQTRKQRSLKREAMNVAAELSGAEVREFVASLGKDETRDLSILRDELELLAEKDPNQFIKLSKNKNKTIHANIKRAIDKEILSFDRATNTFSWSSTGETIVQVPRSSKMGHLEGFTNFVLSNKNGENIYQEIVKLLK